MEGALGKGKGKGPQGVAEKKMEEWQLRKFVTGQAKMEAWIAKA